MEEQAPDARAVDRGPASPWHAPRVSSIELKRTTAGAGSGIDGSGLTDGIIPDTADN